MLDSYNHRQNYKKIIKMMLEPYELPQSLGISAKKKKFRKKSSNLEKTYNSILDNLIDCLRKKSRLEASKGINPKQHNILSMLRKNH